MKSFNIVFPDEEKVVFIEEPVDHQDQMKYSAGGKILVSTGTEARMLRGVADEGTNWLGI
jgi:hypothetical protein